MIIVQLLGGMGNQMFQYAAGRQLALKNDSTFKLDTIILMDWRPGRHLVNRSFDLDIFRLVPEIATKKDIAPYNPQLMSKAEKILFHFKLKIGYSPSYKEKHFHFDNEVVTLKGNQYLAGLWQSYKYFENIEDVIRTDFEFKKKLGPKAAQLFTKINECNSVCINVRRADYVSVKQTADVLGFIGLDYYKKAIDILINKINDAHIFIFSDDIQWCKQSLVIDKHPVMYVDHNYAGEKFSDYFQLMIACSHFIIPNSTFGWWAAWLSKSPGKIIIAPKKWMNDPGVNTDDLIPPAWIRV